VITVSKAEGLAMLNQPRDPLARERDDRILPVTRAVSIVVSFILVLAFVLLYLNPTRTGELWAWEIRPVSTVTFMGSGYAAGAYLFMRTAIGTRWHRVSAPFLPIAGFTVAMLLATLLHWDRFNFDRIAALGWVVLYLITPLLVPWLWFRNRNTDPGTPEARDAVVATSVRMAAGTLGSILLTLAFVGFVFPPFLIDIWAWQLTPLTARVASGWMLVFGGSILIASLDRRWSAWRVVVETAFITGALLLISALSHGDEFTTRSHTQWVSTLGVSLIVMIVFYIAMNLRQRVE
jgi:hypothetical protein